MKRTSPRSDLKSRRTRSAFAAAELKAVLAFETKVGDSISCATRMRTLTLFFFSSFSFTIYEFEEELKTR